MRGHERVFLSTEPTFSGLHSIEQDSGRFRDILKGRVRKNLHEYITDDSMIGKRGKDLVSIPVPRIDLPRFKFGEGKTGVGQGPGDVGDSLGPGDPKDSSGKSGDQPGQHIFEAEFTIDELTEMIAEMIELPNLLPLEGDDLVEYYLKMKGITPNRSIKLAVKRAYLQALKTGAPPVKAMTMINQRGIRKYRGWEKLPRPVTKALIVYEADISGSRTSDERMFDRIMADWISRLVAKAYENKVEELFMVHEAVAKMVSREDFFRLSVSGGTVVSTAYELDLEIAQQFSGWNIFYIHFTDGENFGHEDNQKCVRLVGEVLKMPWVRMFGLSMNDTGGTHDEGLRKMLFKEYQDENRKKRRTGRLATTTVESYDDILGGIVELLGKKQDA